MTNATVNKIDNQLNQISLEQTATAAVAAANYVDRSDLLFEHMNFIALSNKSFLNLK